MSKHYHMYWSTHTFTPSIVGLNSGHIMMLRKDILDPRRNITPTQDMM